MPQRELKEILNRYKSGTATDEEKAFLESWYLQFREEGEMEYTIDERLEDAGAVWLSLNQNKNVPKPMWPKLVAAAALLVFLSFGGLYYMSYKQKLTTALQISKNTLNEIAPGGNKAILTLSNGKKIVLAGIQNGRFAMQGNTTISKTLNGQIVYTPPVNPVPDQQMTDFNTMTTPKGGQYQVILPDGSRVLLNASSSLRYPTEFTGKERKVELVGEAYFEVIHNDALPFRVTTANETVEDLGTHFNINAYNDEQVTKTTLLEGSIKISSENQHVILKPGQQSHLNVGSKNKIIEVIEHADMEEAVAWKNGLFEFKNTSTKQVMSDIARWYDLNVVYEDKVPDLKISGRISRNVDFSGMIKLLEFEGLKFKIKGKNITVFN